MARLAPFLPKELLSDALLSKILKIARGLEDDKFSVYLDLVKLVPYFPESFLEEVLEIIKNIKNQSGRFIVLYHLTPYCPELYSEVLAYIKNNDFDLFNPIEAFKYLAPYMDSDLLLGSLDIARANKHDITRAEMLIILAPYINENLFLEAFEVTVNIEDVVFRTQTLAKLAPFLPKSVLPKALESARIISDTYSLSIALTGLASSYLEVLPEALETIKVIVNDVHRAEAIARLAIFLPEDLLSKALEIARNIGSASNRIIALTGLTSSYSEVLPEALTTAKIIEHPSIRAEALSKLAILASQNQEILSEAFSAAIGLKYAEDRIKALIRLASFLSENQLSGVLEATRIIEKETHLSLAFPQLAFFLQKHLVVRALEIAKLIKNDECRIEKEIHLSLALSELAPFLPRHLLLRALEIAELIKNDECRTEALIGLVPYLHEILPQILVTTKAIKNDKFRAKAFGKLAKYLPELLPEALESTKIITSRYGDTCAEVLLNIAPYLKESRFVEALEITKAIGDVQYRAKALQALISSLKSIKVDLILLKEILHVLGTLTRPHFLETLPNLVPLILHFGGIEALREVHQGIREVSRWWK